jgi:hypothetical protein
MIILRVYIKNEFVRTIFWLAMNAAEELVECDDRCDCEDCEAEDECDVESTNDYEPPFLTKVGTMVAAPFVYAAMLPLVGLGLAIGWILRSNEKHQMEKRNNAPLDE